MVLAMFPLQSRKKKMTEVNNKLLEELKLQLVEATVLTGYWENPFSSLICEAAWKLYYHDND